MTHILIRAVVFFAVLNAVMRLLGKRQMGEMQLTEFVTTVMLSELAVLPVTDPDIPISHGLAGILVLASLEIISSFLSRKSPLARVFFDGKPMLLVAKGNVIEKNLTKSRISTDELFAAIRKEGYCGVDEVDYVILEQTGGISVLAKQDDGMRHAVIVDGTLREVALKSCGRSHGWLESELKRRGLKIQDLLYLTVDDSGRVYFEKRSGN